LVDLGASRYRSDLEAVLQHARYQLARFTRLRSENANLCKSATRLQGKHYETYLYKNLETTQTTTTKKSKCSE